MIRCLMEAKYNVVVVRPVPGRDSFRSGDALVVVDEKRRVREWNAAAEALTGIRSSAALGRKCWDVVGGRTDGAPLSVGRRATLSRVVISRTAAW
jgi:PAS domain S-box-containing protein